MKQANLDSVLLEFRVEAGGGPKPAVLDAYCRKYPEYAQDLTDYAVQWLIGDALAAVEPSGATAHAHKASSSLVSRAISRFHDRLRAAAPSGTAEAGRAGEEIRNPFKELTVARKREIRDELRIDMPLLAKLQNRLIEAESVPRRFLERLAKAVQATVDEVLGYLRLPAMVNAGADFKADGKPSVGAQKERFEEAVRHSTLDEKQKQALLEE
jgi:hypothetical protein